MTKSDRSAWSELRAGQMWKLKDRFVLIVALELDTVRFKFMNSAKQLETPTLTGDVDTLGRYLTARKGKLVKTPSFEIPLPKKFQVPVLQYGA